MSCVYNFSWMSSNSPTGVNYYILSVNEGSPPAPVSNPTGNPPPAPTSQPAQTGQWAIYGNSQDVKVNEGANVFATICAVNNFGASTETALSFVANINPVAPDSPSSFSANFVRFE